MQSRTEILASEFCSSVRDGTHDSPKEVLSGGKPLVTTKHLKGGKIDFDKTYNISEEDFDKINKRSKVDKWDVLISMIGTVGEIYLVEEEPDYAIKNLGLFKVGDELNSKWLYFYLKSKLGQNQIRFLLQGSTQQYISLTSLREFPIFVPNDDKEKQKVINILSALESKIELNQKMNETLEEIAKTLFKSWFINFDPVKAKAEGRPTGLSKEISDLFPDSFEDSEFGEIPKGWKVRSLGDFYAVNKGLSYKGKFLTEHGMPMINLGCFGGNGIFLKEKIKPYSGEFKERHIISKGDIAIANTDMTQNRITLGSPIMVDEIDGNSDFLFTHHVFCLKNISEREDLKYFTYQTLLNPRFRGIAGNYATGTTVLALPKDAIENFQVALPSKQILNAFNEIAGLNFKKSKINYEESIVLGDLRDKLLPKLISGELKVTDTENLIEEAEI